ncbi:hypothetical protein CY34DRAFT_35959, partial [Suillus luteus UH-Slu-Lm8-n1]
LSVSSSEDLKIPKSTGESGCLGHWGYTLCKALDWNLKAFAKILSLYHYFIEKHLDMTKYALVQSSMLLKVMCGKMLNSFPDLENYSDLWPVNDMIMTHLKYMSGRMK